MADTVVARQLLSGARRILAAKLVLMEGLPPGYVHDPAVVILLQLILHHSERSMFHRALCESIPHVSFSVAARWVALLEHDGMIATLDLPARGDPMVSLTPHGLVTVKAIILAMGHAEKRIRDEDASRPTTDAEKGIVSRI